MEAAARPATQGEDNHVEENRSVFGRGGARRLRATGERAAEVEGWLCDQFYVARVVPHDDLMKETLAYAKQLADGPPVAMQLAKRLVYRGLDQSFVEGLEQAQAAMAIVQSTTDSREGPAAFRERRKPLFEGK